MKLRTFTFQGRDVDVSRSQRGWCVTCDGNTVESRQLDSALEGVLGRPGLPKTPHDAFLRLTLKILGHEYEPSGT